MIVYGADDAICKWVSTNLSGSDDMFDDKCKALGVVVGSELLAGIVYTQYIPNVSIEMTVFSIDKRWCSRHTLREIFCYPFIQLRLERTQAVCSANNEGVIMFLKRLGFSQEGFHRKAYFDGSDAVSFGMLKSECKWIEV